MDIAELYQIYEQHPVITTDSRDCPAGSLFFALKGDRFDGNGYAGKALEAGCARAIVDDPKVAVDDRFILVEDVLKTLQELAAHHRRQLTIPVLQITGTNGKTTTKELVSAVLARKYRTLCTQGNLNNHIGVPRTLLRIRPEHEMAVVETGANHPGEIAFLCRMVQADYGLITNVGRAHLEGFGSFEGVKKTKGELYADLIARGGQIFLNGSDADLKGMAGNYARLLPYVQGEVVECSPFLRMAWTAPDGTRHEVQTHLVGSYNLPNLLAAATVGLHFGVEPDEIDEALRGYVPSNSRSEFRQAGTNSLIVDAYNANPTSMGAALDNFALMKAEHKMVILGEMRELGADSLAEHQRIVERLLKSDMERIWLVGDEFARCRVDDSRFRFFHVVEEVMESLQASPLQGCTILIKGSNSTRLHQLSFNS